jgi:hypothetical protein
MLPGQCRWITVDADYCTLAYNYGCVGAVRQRDGYVETRVAWQRYEHYGKAGSLTQGRRFVERWIAARKGFPGYVSRSPVPRNGFPVQIDEPDEEWAVP